MSGSRRQTATLTAALVLLPLLVDGRPDPLKQWPQWRGPLGTGVAPHGNPPLTWSEDHNIRFKVPLPGKGHSTPVIWGDRIFVTSAVPYGDAQQPAEDEVHGAHHNQPSVYRQRFVVLAIDRREGKIVWERTVHRGRPHESTHLTGSWASASPVTDGRHVIASFGSNGVYGLDIEGRLLWRRDLGEMQTKHGHGEGSSPALHGDTVVVNWDHEGKSFVIALDKRTGKQRWKVAREELTSWSTPLIVEHRGRAQVIVAATRRVRAYDLADGTLIWECGGLSGNVVASPVAAGGLVYVGSSYEKRAMLAIRLADAKGDISGTDAVVWTRSRDTPYVPSPVLDGETLCFLKHYQGLLTCLHAESGKTLLGPRRLAGIRNVYASPVSAAHRLYIVDLEGTTLVLEHGAPFEVLARNRLRESFSASPAIAGDELYLRGERYLYAIAREPEPTLGPSPDRADR